MNVITSVDSSEPSLEEHRPEGGSCTWETVASGFWSEGTYHSGYVSYSLTRTPDGVWVMDSQTRNAELDGVTEEDVEEGTLNDDQVQALWGTTLEEAQGATDERVVAVCLDAPSGASAAEIARALYDAVVSAGGTAIDEPDEGGLLAI